MRSSPKTESEFLILIEEIDENFKSRKIPIYLRPIEAVREFVKRLGTSLKLGPACKAVPGKFSGESLTGHIFNWYSKKYGERLKIDFSPGHAAILIKGDAWKIVTPGILGSVRFTCDRNLNKYGNVPKLSFGSDRPVHNVLRYVEGLSTDYAKILTNNELIDILQFFNFLIDTLYLVQHLRQKPFVSEAKADYDSSVLNIFTTFSNYGLSKWGSLQFIEKFIKCHLAIMGLKIPKTHDLTKLSILARQNGLPNLSSSLIAMIQCPAGVRYGEIHVTLEEAVFAHHAALRLCNYIARTIKNAK